jgi:hypothetical protein
VQAGYPAPPGPWPYGPPPPRRSKGTAFALAVVALVAVAALVMSIVDLTRSPISTNSAASNPTTSAGTSPPADTTAANRALCSAIAPLMTENNRVSKTLSDQVPSGSPGWNAAMPKFISDTKDWLTRIQPIIDSHRDVDPFLHRSLQRFVDDQRFLVADLQEGPWAPYDQTIWNDGLGADNGPLNVCWDLGIKW